MNKKLSVQVNGQAFVELRRIRGWSQEELSRRSGYSVRVVRKAEASDTIRSDTLQAFCEAFSATGGQVKLEDLTASLLSIAQKIVYCYDNHGIDMLQGCRDYFTPDIVYHIHADKDRVPYAGRWEGLDGFQKMLDIFYGMFTRRPGTLKPTYLVGDQRVHARFLDQAFYKGEETPPIYINLHFQFRGAKVFQVDNEFDTDLTVASLAATDSKGSKPV